MKTPQSASKGKQPVKEKKARGKKGKKSNPNKDSPKKQVSVFEIKEYRLRRRLKHKSIWKVHGMDFNSWWQYCEHFIEMHCHLKKYPCKLCKKKCSSLQAFTVHCAKHEEDSKRFQCEICLQKFMLPSTFKNHMHKHGGQFLSFHVKMDLEVYLVGKNSNIKRHTNNRGKPMTYLQLNVCLKGV